MIYRLLGVLGWCMVLLLVALMALGLFDLLAILVYWTVKGAVSL